MHRLDKSICQMNKCESVNKFPILQNTFLMYNKGEKWENKIFITPVLSFLILIVKPPHNTFFIEK